ncbi:LOW QUALITY PROTEIN: UBN2 domain-containing protein, partial [Cephalotus follicularis]
PHFFYGDNYSHWKKMTIFIQSLNYNLWDLIVDGPNLATTTNEHGEIISKPRNKYNDEDRKIVQLNAKAKHIIICATNSNEFNRVSSCVSAKDMWDRLEVTYEGTNQLKEAKINMFVHEYEMFTMHDNEDIKTMKKKAMIATWDDSDDSSSDEETTEEVTQIVLMAIEEEED